MANIQWARLYQSPCGHSFWQAHDPVYVAGKPYSIAIADRSGDTPSTTEDGVLWVRLTDPVRVYQQGGDDFFSLPVINAAGELVSTPASVSEVLWACSQLGMHIQVGADEYEVRHR